MGICVLINSWVNKEEIFPEDKWNFKTILLAGCHTSSQNELIVGCRSSHLRVAQEREGLLQERQWRDTSYFIIVFMSLMEVFVWISVLSVVSCQDPDPTTTTISVTQGGLDKDCQPCVPIRVCPSCHRLRPCQPGDNGKRQGVNYKFDIH